MTVIHQFLEDAAAMAPQRAAIESNEIALTTSQLQACVRSLATWLLVQGVRRGDRIIIEAENTAMTVVLIHAISTTGGCFIPVHSSIPAKQRAYIAQDAGATMVVAARAGHWIAETATHSVNLPDLNTLCAGEATPSVISEPGPELIGEDLACMIYTSGSTGHPKGVACLHRQMVFAVKAISEALDYRDGDRIFCALPLSFDYGLYQLFLALASGATLCLQNPEIGGLGLFKALKHSHASVLPAVPVMIETLAVFGKRKPGDLQSLRLVTNTGAAPSPASIKALRHAFPGLGFQLMYGLTECKRVSIAAVDADLQKPGTCGRPLKGTRVEVVDECGEPLPPGTIGEFVISGPHLMAGYWNAEVLTEETYRRSYATLRRLHTGDYGWMDADGHLYCEGRRDDVFKVRGFRVSCTEIEAACAEAPDVQHAVMIAPSEGRLGTLFVCMAGEKSDLRKFLSERLEPYKVPEKIRYVAQMPRTNNNKFDRNALVRLLEEGVRSGPYSPQQKERSLAQENLHHLRSAPGSPQGSCHGSRRTDPPAQRRDEPV